MLPVSLSVEVRGAVVEFLRIVQFYAIIGLRNVR